MVDLLLVRALALYRTTHHPVQSALVQVCCKSLKPSPAVHHLPRALPLLLTIPLALAPSLARALVTSTTFPRLRITPLAPLTTVPPPPPMPWSYILKPPRTLHLHPRARPQRACLLGTWTLSPSHANLLSAWLLPVPLARLVKS
jgi:hypothetical protein